MEVYWPLPPNERFEPVETDSVVYDVPIDEAEAEAAKMLRQTVTQQEILEANQELFCRPSAIPIVNRYRYLIGEVPDFTEIDKLEYLDADEFAASVGLEFDSFLEFLGEMNVPSEMLHVDDEKNLQLAPGVDVVLEDELDWRAYLSTLGPSVTIPTIANYFGMSYEYVKSIFKRANVEPIAASGNHYYPKEMLHHIRSEVMLFPPARNRKNMFQIMGDIGCSQSWFICNIGEDKDTGDLVRVESSHVVEGFPLEVQERLRDVYEKRPEAVGEDQYTRTAMAHLLGRDVTWVDVKLMGLQRDARAGVGKCGTVRTHYGADVFEALKRIAEAEDETPEMTPDMILLEEMAALAGTVEETAEPILRELGIVPEQRKSLYNRKIVAAYRYDDIFRLAEAIVDKRATYLEKTVGAIRLLEAKNRTLLTVEERKRLRSLKLQRAATVKRLESARQALHNLRQQNEQTA